MGSIRNIAAAYSGYVASLKGNDLRAQRAHGLAYSEAKQAAAKAFAEANGWKTAREPFARSLDGVGPFHQLYGKKNRGAPSD